MKYASGTHKGRVRFRNEDACTVGELPGEVVYAVVCDGMGGANGGDIASHLAVETTAEKLRAGYRIGMNSNSIRRLLETSVTAANIMVFHRANDDATLAGMGTTVVAAMATCHLVQIIHAGDSRAYLVRSGVLKLLTKDHSVVQSMVEIGAISAKEAQSHPKKNVITRALGVEEGIDLDYDEVEIEEGDLLLLCSDGLSNFVEPEEILSLCGSVSTEELPDALIYAANQKGGGDNITVVAIAF